MNVEPRRLALALAGFQAVDAVACAIPLRYIKADLDRIGCPDELRRALPVIKALSSAGLLVGLKVPRLGALTCAALGAYFVCAVGFHVRAGDHPLRSVPAIGVGTCAVITGRRAFRPGPLRPTARPRLPRG